MYEYNAGAATDGMRFADDSTAPSAAALKTGEVLIEVKAAAINPVDYKLRALLPRFALNGRAVAQDFSGVVIESKSSKYQKGAAVYGNASGSIAERLVAADKHIAYKPPSISFNEAASLPTVALTGYQAFKKGGLKEGGSALVVGASGGCGIVGVQIARAMAGCQGMVAGICSTANVPFVQQLDAQATVLDYKYPETFLEPKDGALTRASPCGWDVIYDTVTSPDNGDNLKGQRYDVLLEPFRADKGKVVAINGSAWRWTCLFLHKMTMGVFASDKYALHLMQRSSDDLTQIAHWVRDGEVRPILDSVHTFSAEGCAAAYTRLKSRRAKGKVVINISNGDSY